MKSRLMACNRRKGTFGYLRRVSFQMASSTRKGTFGHSRKLSSRISLLSLRRLIRNDTFHFYVFSCFEPAYLSLKSNEIVKCRLGLARGLRRLIRDDNLRKCPNIPLRVLQPICGTTISQDMMKWKGNSITYRSNTYPFVHV